MNFYNAAIPMDIMNTISSTQTAVNGKVSKAGDTMTGNLHFANQYTGVYYFTNDRRFTLENYKDTNQLSLTALDAAGNYIATPFYVDPDGAICLGTTRVVKVANFLNKALARTDARAITYNTGELMNIGVRTKNGASATTSFIVMTRK